MSAQPVVIRRLEASDHAGWERLWRGYLRFYRARLDPAVTETTWKRLVDPAEQPHGLVAVEGAAVIGLVHYLFHRSSWTLTEYCYLEDLYVDPEARGHGAGRALIQAVYKAADAAGATRVYWSTQEFNAEARALYDTLARRTSFVQYRR
jgi:GNAT superfamily N-acetyltransferase